MTGGGNGKGIKMYNPDGTPMTKNQVIIQRRGAFLWLPVLFSNDLEHGSWWFVLGSLLTALCAVYPIAQREMAKEQNNDDLLPATDFDLTWAMIIISGVFFTFGSLAFVRAFSEPAPVPLLKDYKHFQTDELLGAWLFLFGTVPAVPYMLVYFLIAPSAFYFFGLCAAIVFVFASYLFVAACYPSDKKHENIVLPFFIRMFGPKIWIIKHLANDWMAGTWFFLWANILLTVASFFILIIALAQNDSMQIFLWVSGFFGSFLFLMGSFYYVAGSYPHASQFYYETGRGHIKENDDSLMKYQRVIKEQAVNQEKKIDYSNRILRLSLTATMVQNNGYQKLNEDPADPGVGGDIEKGHRPRNKKANTMKFNDRPASAPAPSVSNPSAAPVSNPLHAAATTSNNNNNHNQNNPLVTPGKVPPVTPAKTTAEAPAIPQAGPSIPLSPPPASAAAQQLSPVVEKKQTNSDYVFVADVNAADDDDDVDDDRHQHHLTEMEQLELLETMRGKASTEEQDSAK